MSEMDEFEERPTMDSPQQVQPVDSIPSDQSQRVNDEPEEDDIEEQHADSEVGNAVCDNDQVEEAVAEELGEGEAEDEEEDEEYEEDEVDEEAEDDEADEEEEEEYEVDEEAEDEDEYEEEDQGEDEEADEEDEYEEEDQGEDDEADEEDEEEDEDLGEEEEADAEEDDEGEGIADAVGIGAVQVACDGDETQELAATDPNANQPLAAADHHADLNSRDDSGLQQPSRDSGSRMKSTLQFQAVALPLMHGEPVGMRRADGNGCELLDAMAGRNSVFGFGYTPIQEAMAACLSRYLGDGSLFSDVVDSGESPLSRQLDQVFAGSTSVSADSMLLLPSPDLALEHAIQIARRFRPDKSFRTIAMLGSDHGRTGMCRTASGRPHLHEGLGPMMAGFSHVPVGDLEAVRATVGDQTAGILLSPIDIENAALACASDYLAGVREVCNERGVLLIIDETQIVFGSTGEKFAFSALADVHADIVVASSGLFAGLPGGLVLASHHVMGGSVRDLQRYPLVAAALMATISEMHNHGLPADVSEAARNFAVAMAEQLNGFEFIRDMNVTGMTIGIETDINADDIVAAAAASGLRVETAGDTAIRLQPPLLMSEEDRQLLLERLVESMEVIERETSGLAL